MSAKEETKDQQKSKRKKPAVKLTYISSDEETDDCQPSESIFAKKQNELKTQLAQNRINTIERCRSIALSNVDGDTEDVFADPRTVSNGLKHGNKEVDNELLELLQWSQSQKDDKTDDMIEINVQNDSIELNEESTLLDESLDTNVAHNTRSRRGFRGRGRGRGRGRKKSSGRGRGRKNSLDFEQKTIMAFEGLDRVEAMDEIEVIEDKLNVSMTQEVDDYIKDRNLEIKVKYKAVIQKFSMKPNEKFSKTLPTIANAFNEKVADLVLTLNDKIIDTDSTPQAIGLLISDIIDCHKRGICKSTNNSVKDPNDLSLKLRDITMKSHEILVINKFETISKVKEWFAKFRNIPIDKFRLEFDGDRLESDSTTITDCDIEDESQIDVILL